MNSPLTSNTQAILLLTAPLIVGHSERSPNLLTLTEYNRLARILREKQKQPADLIGSDGLAAYAWTRSAKTANAIASSVETGMITINHLGLALPEVPFGGVKDSGYGSEGGLEAMEPYLNPKFVSQAGL